MGMVTAAGLTELANEVIGTDIVSDKIEKASQGKAPFYEPGQEELLQSNLEKGNFSFSLDLEQTILFLDVFFCLREYSLEEGWKRRYVLFGKRFLKYGPDRNRYNLIVGKSTVPIQTSLLSN